MPDALIGYTGFVGSTLLRQRHFDDLYRSTNIRDIQGKSYGMVVCAGAPAQKWLANKDPEDDARKLDSLMESLKAVQCETFVLISTVDVFKDPTGVDERSANDTDGLHPYGLHRRRLEEFVVAHFDRHLIVRLPGLVGPGLRKNVIFDLLNDNNLAQIDSRGVFQFYPMVNLWSDVERALSAELKVVHLTSEPIAVRDVAEAGFGRAFDQPGRVSTPPSYDMKTAFAALWGSRESYQYDRQAVLLAIRAYAQSEPKTMKS